MAGIYNSIISRTDADSLIPTEQAQAVIKAATQESIALTMFGSAQLSTKVQRQPVMAALPVAYFVSGDTGLKQSTEMAWAGIDLVAEEIAAIVPIPEAVVDDASYDTWGEIRPALAEAVAQVLDAACISGLNKPASWPAAIFPAAIAAGNVVELGTATAAQGYVPAERGHAHVHRSRRPGVSFPGATCTTRIVFGQGGPSSTSRT